MKATLFSKRCLLKYLAVITLLSCLAACTAKNYPPLQTASYVDPDKFAGRWFVIANIPYFAERNKVGSQTIYRKRKDRLYDDIFVARNKNFSNPEKSLKGSVRILNDTNTRWKSTFYWILNFTFDVVHVEDDYSFMLLGHPSRDYGWVMARTNTLSDGDYQQAMEIFVTLDYNIERFSKVPQLVEQLGQPGFQ